MDHLAIPVSDQERSRLVTRANRQPAVANYVRKPGDDGYSPMALDVVRIVDGEVADNVTFDGSVFPWFDLPESL
jgi:hypothetical protein